jgi:hypothetical protein
MVRNHKRTGDEKEIHEGSERKFIVTEEEEKGFVARVPGFASYSLL